MTRGNPGFQHRHLQQWRNRCERPNKDGLSATSIPSGVKTMPVEATENALPSFSGEKNIGLIQEVQDAGVGDLGQVMEIEGKDQQPFNVLAMFDRCPPPPRGRAGGEEGTAGRGQPGFRQETPCQSEQTIPRETGSNWNCQAEADSEIPITVNRNESRKISRMV